MAVLSLILTFLTSMVANQAYGLAVGMGTIDRYHAELVFNRSLYCSVCVCQDEGAHGLPASALGHPAVARVRRRSAVGLAARGPDLPAARGGAALPAGRPGLQQPGVTCHGIDGPSKMNVTKLFHVEQQYTHSTHLLFLVDLITEGCCSEYTSQ